jgi:hypothetical protein
MPQKYVRSLSLVQTSATERLFRLERLSSQWVTALGEGITATSVLA